MLRSTDSTRCLALIAPPVGQNPPRGGSLLPAGGESEQVIRPIAGRLAQDFWRHAEAWRRQGRAVVVVTHLLTELHRADQVLELRKPTEAGQRG